MAKNHLIRFDWAIKRLLRNKADYTVLEGFLSVLLNREIKILTIKESEGNREDPNDKINRVDIFVEDSKGEFLIIEVQNSYQVDYLLRMLYGVSKAITEHIKKGGKYGSIRKIYHINIIYFPLGDGGDYVYHGITDFTGIHHNNPLILTEKQKEFFVREYAWEVFPEYYILCAQDFDKVAQDGLDEWIYYLKNTEIPEHFSAQGLKEAREQLLYNNMSEEEQKDYDHHLYQTRFEEDVIGDNYDLGVFDGKKMGRVEGEAIGLEKGEEERSRLKAEKEALEAKIEALHANLTVRMAELMQQTHK